MRRADEFRAENGFTMVEVLMVLLIMGILAAIAIPVFFNQREKAQDSDAKLAAKTAQTAMETWGVDHDGDYTPAPTAAQLQAIDDTLPASLGISGVSANGYTVTASSESGRTFSVMRAGGGFSHPCSASGGGCPSDLDWGG